MWSNTVNQPIRRFPELAHRLSSLSLSTRKRLTSSLVHALRGRRHGARSPLHEAIGDGCMELRAAGMNDPAILTFFGALVEETGRACGADRPSLMSGELRWMPVRARVLELAGAALALPPAEALLAMDHVNGQR
jgi:hypothetical protein